MKSIFAVLGFVLLIAGLSAIGALAWNGEWTPVGVAFFGSAAGRFVLGFVEVTVTPLAVAAYSLMARRRSALAFPLMLLFYLFTRAAYAAYVIAAIWYFAGTSQYIGPWLAMALGVAVANGPSSWAAARTTVSEDEYDHSAFDGGAASIGSLVMAGLLLAGLSYFHAAIAVVVTYALAILSHMIASFSFIRQNLQLEYLLRTDA